MVSTMKAHRLLTVLAVLVLITTNLSLVSSDYILSIIIEDFSNPTNQNANGSCCADLSQMSGCLQSCNERMNLCLREAGHPANDTTNCSLFKTNSIDINLKTLNLPTMSGPWPVELGVQLLVQVNSAQGTLVDNIVADIRERVDASPDIVVFVGEHRRANLTLRLAVRCAVNFIGIDCNTLCQNNCTTSSAILPSMSTTLSQSETPISTQLSTVLSSSSATLDQNESPIPTQSSSTTLDQNESPIPTQSSSTTLDQNESPIPTQFSSTTLDQNESPIPTQSSTAPPSLPPSMILITPGVADLTPGPGGLSSEATAGISVGVLLGVLILLIIIILVSFLILVHVRKHQHRHKGNHWLVASNSGTFRQARVLESLSPTNDYTINDMNIIKQSNDRSTPPNGASAQPYGASAQPRNAMNGSHGWYDEPEAKNLTFDHADEADEESIFSATSFETESRHSAVNADNDKVLYSSVLVTREGIEEEISDKEGNAVTDKVLYTSVMFQSSQEERKDVE